jgi:hypothetical protein
MIANPSVPAFRYDPYSKKFTRELYEHEEMRGVRADAVRKARKTLVESGSGSWAVVLGTLGRQGSLAVLKVGGSRVAGRGSWAEIVMSFIGMIFSGTERISPSAVPSYDPVLRRIPCRGFCAAVVTMATPY